MNQTPNYALSQWSKEDRVLMEDFNADNAKIDGALAAHAAELDKLSPLPALAAKHGNCQIETFSYTGTGMTTEGKTITFKKKPLFFMAFGPVYSGILAAFASGGTAYYIGITPGGGNDTVYRRLAPFSWNKNNGIIHDRDVTLSMDREGETYQVVAFYAMDKK